MGTSTTHPNRAGFLDRLVACLGPWRNAKPAFDPRATPPSTLFLSMSTSNICNFRCKMCHIWLNEDRIDGLSTEDRVDIIRKFARLNPEGRVQMPGGEVTLDLPTLLTLAGTCKEHGLACSIVTNGSKIVDEEVARLLVESGLTNVCVSLDSHLPRIHEHMRGMPGCHPQTLRAIELLVQARHRYNPDFRVATSCVLCKLNIERFAEYLDFCAALGVDHVDFQLLTGTFSNQAKDRDVFFEKEFWHDPASKQDAKRPIRELVTREAAGRGLLVKTVSDLDWIEATIDDPDFESEEPVCGSHERNLMINTSGDVQLCFNTQKILAQPFVGNTRQVDLREAWTGATAREHRAVMDRCKLGCGTLTCHRKQA